VAILVRSIAFNVLFYLNTFIHLIAGLPTFFMPYRAIVGVAKSWGRVNLVLLRVVAGVDYEIRGREKIPKGPLIIASKHQSAWETFALLPLLENPLFILLAHHQGPYGPGRSRRWFTSPRCHDRARSHRTCG
jgi:1-acyl-sn-glycerol-3-phosphate acyltransferase